MQKHYRNQILALKKKQHFTARYREGAPRYTVPIYVFPEMKLRSLVISKTEL